MEDQLPGQGPHPEPGIPTFHTCRAGRAVASKSPSYDAADLSHLVCSTMLMRNPGQPTVASPHRPLWAASILFLLSTSLSAQIWSEEFNGGTSPNSAVWSYDLGGSGWGNNELQTYTNNSNNVRVEGGHLIITALQQSGSGGQPSFTSARIRTQDKLTLQYGTVEARIKIPDLGNGLWPAFWTLGNNFSSVGWPDCGEIDVLEMGSVEAISSGVVNRRVY